MVKHLLENRDLFRLHPQPHVQYFYIVKGGCIRYGGGGGTNRKESNRVVLFEKFSRIINVGLFIFTRKSITCMFFFA